MSDPAEDIGCHSGLEQDPASRTTNMTLTIEYKRKENKIQYIAQKHESHFFLSLKQSLDQKDKQTKIIF